MRAPNEVAMPLVRPIVPRPRPPSPVRIALDAIRARREHEDDGQTREEHEPRPVLPSLASAAELAW